MAPLPTGTLTMLFSDIEGSTAMLKGLGPLWGEALSAQRRLLRSAFAGHGGYELGTEGDSFFVVFGAAHEALAAAIDAQRAMAAHEWPSGRPLRVRMGLHTGEPQRHEDGYIGLDVHRAARIAATAHGGQIVLSAATQALVTGSKECRLRDLGWHRLKDVPGPEHLFDVVAPGLAAEHPPLRSLGTSANLPAYPTELIGREGELADIVAAFDDDHVRLVTLTGTAGTGKTRLAVAVATAMETRFGADVYFAELHTADRAALMWSAIAETVGAGGDAEQMPDERALAFLAGRRAVLVLDNLEQIPGADAVVSELLNAAPDVRVLATSRRPLHLIDEYQFPVPPLPVPEPGDDLHAVRTGAVALFVRRARMAKPSFRLTPANADDVIALCRRLDGLPLAIELAAARSRLLSPKALLHRMDDWLTDAPLTGRASRQRTLRAAITWSYDLLDEDDQRVFRQLGVFAGRFGLEAVGHVVGAQERDPLDVIAHLVDVSLVEIAEGPDGEPLVFLLQTVRQFAREMLRDSPEHEAVRLSHARWCREVAIGISGLLHGPHQMTALDRMKAVEEDIRAALDWCLAADASPTGERAECGFALLEPMDEYWYRFGYVAEGRGWHDRALRLLAADDVPDSPEVVDALHGHGVLALQQQDLETGAQALERALDMAHRLADCEREARELNSLGIAHREAGRVQDARDLIERSLALARTLGDRHREATALTNMVHIHMDLGQYAEAVDAARRAVAADAALQDPWGVAINRSNLVVALLHAEGPMPAYDALRDVLADAATLGDAELTIDVVETAAAVWAGLGDAARSALLLGVAAEQRRVAQMPRAAANEQYLDRFIAPARATLLPERWEAAMARGQALDVEHAVREALAAPTSVPPQNRPVLEAQRQPSQPAQHAQTQQTRTEAQTTG